MTETTPDNERARIESRIRAEERARVENAVQAGDAAEAGSVFTEEERAGIEERALVDARELMLFVARYRRDVGGRTDEELIAEARPSPEIRHQLELTRRLIESDKNLQSELARSRESAEQLTTDLSNKMTGLTGELVKFRTSSDKLAGLVLRWTRVLAGLTVVLLLGTGVLIWLTVVLVQRTAAGPAATTHPAAHASPSSRPASQAARPTSARSR